MKSFSYPGNPVLLAAGGPVFEKILRNRGRTRNALANYQKRQLANCYDRFVKGDWKPQSSPRVSEVPVSLTSWRPRLPDLPLVLLTLILQKTRPGHIYLWLTSEDRKLLDENVERLFEPYGVVVRETEDYKCHKKWLPMMALDNGCGRFAICDDDIIYPPEWFSSLLSEDRDDAYVGTRGHLVEYDAEGKTIPYARWRKMVGHSGRTSMNLLLTGCGGALIHKERIPSPFREVDSIMKYCPGADDIWLHFAHRMSEIPGYKTKYGFPCIELPGSDSSGLAKDNVDKGRNDQQWRQVEEFSLSL